MKNSLETKMKEKENFFLTKEKILVEKYDEALLSATKLEKETKEKLLEKEKEKIENKRILETNILEKRKRDFRIPKKKSCRLERKIARKRKRIYIDFKTKRRFGN